MSYESEYTATISTINLQESTKVTENYSEILNKYGLEYNEAGYHLQVGEITAVQGWILHVSVVRSQIVELLEILVPVLISQYVPFKIVKDKDAARSLLDGEFGYSLVGKVISIYPVSNKEAVLLVIKLIPLTEHFKGPAVLTDIHLGGNIYTRYGGFSPIIMTDSAGKKNSYIYDPAGNLIPDAYAIPFSLPVGIEWPFGNMASPIAPPPKKLLNQIYKPISTLKADAKGDVIKAIYLRQFFRVNWCVVKQGKKNMWSDGGGRDIKDRLRWQQQLHKQLAGIVPLPKILDLFTENGDTYLAMEFIKGPSLYNYITDLNYKCCAWEQIPAKSQLLILDFLLQLIHIIDRMHQKGYVHRDITPVNFLVDRKKRLFLIDIELAYSLSEQRPAPPFEFGTHGFISPGQMQVNIPTIKEDLYGLGATMITLLTGLPPNVFNTSDAELLRENLSFFIGNKPMADIITACLDAEPTLQPSVNYVYKAVQQFKELRQRNEVRGHYSLNVGKVDERRLKSIIEGAIKGLVSPPTVMANGLWQSRAPSKDKILDSQRQIFGKSGGIYEGISGVLYFLGKAKHSGFEIAPCLDSYAKGWEYIRANYLKESSNVAPGLYGGAAGIALSMATGMDASLIENNEQNRSCLQQCLELPSAGLDVAIGAAGQGIAALQCSPYLEDQVLQKILQKCINTLITGHRKNEYWITLQDASGKHRQPAASFSQGNSGITWFLLEYAARFNDLEVRQVALKSLAKLKALAPSFTILLKHKGFRKIIENPQTRDGLSGIILVFIKAYETLHDESYKQLAEKILLNYPSTLVHEIFTQDTGVAGMGDLYLETCRIFKNSEWQIRADWIAQFFIHTCRREEDGTYHWLSNNSAHPTADLMVGNSGIIYFLIRYLSHNKISYHLLR